MSEILDGVGVDGMGLDWEYWVYWVYWVYWKLRLVGKVR